MKTLLKNRYLITSLLLISMSACDTQSDELTHAKPTPTKASQAEPKPIETADDTESIEKEDVVENGTVTAINVDTTKANCDAVSAMMSQVGNNSKIEAIKQVNEALPTCLKQTDSTTALKLLTEYDKMYNRFLDDGLRGGDDLGVFSNLAYKVDSGETLTKTEQATLNPHLRYLLTLSQSDEDVYLKYIGEGYYTFSHDLSAMVSRFAPYLTKQDRAFFERMAKDNQDIFWNDASITVSLENLIERALFWEDYLKRYPNGRHKQEAQQLYNIYRFSVIYGSDNTDWTDDAMHYFYEPEDNLAMIELSHQPNSQLAKDAEKFLKFMQTSDAERRGDIEPNGDDYQDIYIARQRVDEVLQIPNPWQAENSIDCFTGIFCR